MLGKRSWLNGIAISTVKPRLVDLAGRVPDRVPRRALVAIHVVVDQVHLHAERVDEELERAALIVEGVEHDADEIVVERRVAIAQIGANRLRVRIARIERDQELIAVLDEVSRRLDLGRLILARVGFDRQRQDAARCARSRRRARRRSRTASVECGIAKLPTRPTATASSDWATATADRASTAAAHAATRIRAMRFVLPPYRAAATARERFAVTVPGPRRQASTLIRNGVSVELRQAQRFAENRNNWRFRMRLGEKARSSRARDRSSDRSQEDPLTIARRTAGGRFALRCEQPRNGYTPAPCNLCRRSRILVSAGGQATIDS